MTGKKIIYQSKKHGNVIFGVLFGFLFIVVAYTTQVVLNNLDINLVSFVETHQQQPLMWIIDFAPLVLGLYGWVIGKYYSHLSRVESRLSSLNDDYEETLLKKEKSEKEKEFILNSVTENVSFHDKDLRIIWANKSVIKSSGLPADQIIGRQCHTIWHDSEQACSNCPVAKCLKTGKSHELKRASGDGKHLLIKGFPVFDDDGEIIGVVEVSKDITAEVNYEQTIKSSEEKYRHVVERAGDGIAIIQDRVFTYVNPQLAFMLGYEQDELIGVQFRVVVSPSELSKLEDNYSNRMAGGYVPPVYESELMHKNGGLVSVEINGGVTTFDGKKADLVFIRDISERKNAEYALLEAEERYRDLVENINEVIFALDTNGVIEYISPTIKYIAEYIPPEMIDKPVKEFIYREDLPEFNERLQTVLDGEPVVFECRIVTRYSSVCWLRISAKPAYSDEKIVGIQGLMIDVTNQRAAERALYESEKRYKAVTEVTSDYAYMYKVDDNGDLILDWVAGAVHLISGYTSDEIISKGGFVNTMVYPDDVELVNIHVKRLLSNKEDVLELRIITKAGKIRYLRHMGRPIWNSQKSRVTEIIGAGKDITDFIEAENTIKKSEERLSLALEASNEGLWDMNMVNGDIYFSPRYYTMLGYEPGEFPPSMESWMNLVHPDDRQIAIEGTDKAIHQGHSSINIEFRMKAKDGSWRMILARSKVVDFDSAGKPLRVVGTHIDITEVKEAVEALKESEETFRTITSAANDAIIMMNPDGKISFWNEMAETIFGYTREEVKGKQLHQLIASESHNQAYRNALPLFQRDGIGKAVGKTLELEAIRKDGDSISVELSLSTLKLKNKWHAVGIVRDITERKKAENEIRESRQMLQLVLNNIPQRIFWKNKQSIYLGCNSHFARDAGYSKTEELIGQSDYDMPWRNTDAEIFRKDDLFVMDNNKPKYNIIERQSRPDGSIAWLNTNKVPLLGIDGNVVGLLGTYEDITERKQAEQQNKLLQEKLEKAKRMESLGLLAGGIAHDLNNTLSPLVGYSDLILGELKSNDPMRKRIERIYRASQDAADVIQDLLTMARRGRYEMAPINLSDVVRQYIESPGYIQKKELHSEVTVKLSLDEEIPNIIGSTPHLTKVVMNLIVNAFDAMPNSGRLVVETSKIYLDELLGGQSYVEPGDYIALRVSDSGVGIPPEDLKKIFEPYYSKKKLGVSGSGLGLAVVYGIVKDHHGYYDIISTVGEGTTFVIYFPITGKEAEIQKDNGQDLRGSESILIVEDSPEQRQLTVELLKTFGYKIESVEHGHAAIEYLTHHSVDLVILDMIMEENYDGLDTFVDILKINPSQKALVVSGYSASERVNKMLKLGAGSFLKKPFTRDKIGSAVRDVLGYSPAKPQAVKV